jgi:hypothetical protein
MAVKLLKSDERTIPTAELRPPPHRARVYATAAECGIPFSAVATQSLRGDEPGLMMVVSDRERRFRLYAAVVPMISTDVPLNRVMDGGGSAAVWAEILHPLLPETRWPSS